MKKSEEILFEKILRGEKINFQQLEKKINSIGKKLSILDIRNSLKRIPKLVMKDEQLSLIFKKLFKTHFKDTILHQALLHIFIKRNSVFHESEPEMIKGRYCHRMIFKNEEYIWTKIKIEVNDFFIKKGLIAIMGSMGLGKTTYILEFLEIYFTEKIQKRPLMIIELKNGLNNEFKDDFKKLLVNSCIDTFKLYNFPMDQSEDIIISELTVSLYNNPIIIIDGIDEYRGDPYTLQLLLSNLRKYGTVFIFGREERIKNLVDKNLGKTYDFYDELYILSYLNIPLIDSERKRKIKFGSQRNQILEYMSNFAKWKNISKSALPSIEELAEWAPDRQSYKLSYRNPLILKILLLNTSSLDSSTRITQFNILEKLANSTFEWFLNKFKDISMLSEPDLITIEGIKIQENLLIKSFFKIYTKLAIRSRFKKWENHQIWIPNEKFLVINETIITNLLDKLTIKGELRKELYIFYFFDFLTSCSGFLQLAGEKNYQILPERMIDFFILYEINTLIESIKTPNFKYKLCKIVGSIIGNSEENSNLIYQIIRETKKNTLLDNICTQVIEKYGDLKQFKLLKEVNLSWKNHSKIRSLRGNIVFIDSDSIERDALFKVIHKFDSLKYLDLQDRKLKNFPEQIEFLNSVYYLNLTNNYIEEIPNWIYNYRSLGFLNLRNNNIKFLPNSICYLFNLKKLLLGNNKIARIPTSIKFLSSLERLDLTDNKLQFIPKSIGKVKSLKFIYIGYNNLLSIPNSIGDLKSLEILYLKKNRISKIPNTLTNLQNLRKLNLAENEISVFNLSKLKSLENLDISFNVIQSLPENISTLESLETLNLQNNILGSLPDSIDQLKALKQLNIANNKLQSIPSSILNLNSLDEIIFSDNPFYDTLLHESNAVLKKLEDMNKVVYLNDYSKYFCPENLKKFEDELEHRATDIFKLKKKNLPFILSPKDLTEFLNTDFPTLLKYINWGKYATPSDYNYRRFNIKKKSKGFREILAPKPQLKVIQQEIYEKILKKIPPSESTHGFRIGHSTVTNAKVHLNAKLVYNIDIKDFFPSIKFDKVLNFFKTIGYSGIISFLLSVLCTAPPRRYTRKTKNWVLSKNSLSFVPQGAPTSPALSNFVCHQLDSKIASLALEYGYRYTRYADDLTFSCEDSNKIDPKFRSRLFNSIKNYGFKINLKKERYSKNYKPLKVTGIVINNDFLSLPRNWVKNLRAALFQYKMLSKSGDIEEILSMQRKIEGYCSYANMVNKEKYKKYFEEFIKIKTSNLNILKE